MNEEDLTVASDITEWDDKRWESFEHWIKNILRDNVVDVTFRKNDGKERVMSATLMGQYIGAYRESVIVTTVEEQSSNDAVDFPEIKPQRRAPPLKPGTIRVFDTEINEWRSFKVRNITNIYQLLIKYGDTL